MITPSENEKFAIPLVAEKVNLDAEGNYVPNVIRDKYDRIVSANGVILGGKIPKGGSISPLAKSSFFKEKYNVQQIIPACWGGSGSNPDNLIFPSHRQVNLSLYQSYKLVKLKFLR